MRAPRSLAALGSVALALLLGCGTARPDVSCPTGSAPFAGASSAAASVVDALSASSAVAQLPPATDTISVARRAGGAEGVTIDGDLSEWGASSSPGSTGPDKQSRILVAPDHDRFVIAGDIEGYSRVTVTISFGVPEFPETGFAGRQLTTPSFCHLFGMPDMALCDRIGADRVAFVERERARFVRRFFITESTILTTDAEGRALLASTKPSVKKRDAGSWSFEVDVPLLALPRIASDGSSIELGASFADDAPTRSKLEGAPVAFDPDGVTAAFVIDHPTHWMQLGTNFVLSYQPGAGSSLERTAWADDLADSTRLETVRLPLFSKVWTKGDLEIGIARTGWTELMSRKGGVPVATSIFPFDLVPTRIVEKAGGALAINVFKGSTGLKSHKSDVVYSCFVESTGVMHCDRNERPETAIFWTNLTQTISPDLETITMTGAGALVSEGKMQTSDGPYVPAPSKPRTVVLKWNATAMRYDEASKP